MLGSRPVMTFLASTDLRRARRFYEGTLGLGVMSEEPAALTFDAGGTRLRMSWLERLTPAPFTVLGWVVENIDASVTALSQRGVVFERVPALPQDARGTWTAPDQTKVAWFKDPDGNLLSLTQFP